MWLACATVLAQVAGSVAFVVPGRAAFESNAQALRRRGPGPEVVSRRSSTGSPSIASAALASAVAIALLRRSRRESSPVTVYHQAARNRVERNWWFVEEDRDPTTIPVWQRDYRYGFQVLRRSMTEARKKGEKVFWDVKVYAVEEQGTRVEMMNSGLQGWMPRYMEGTKERPKVGDVLKAECTACPMQRINGETKHSPWPVIYKKPHKAQPQFSHRFWLEQQRSIKFAQTLEAGQLIKGLVYKQCPKGLVMDLDSENGRPKGMLDMNDISRKKSSHKWVAKMFPPKTEMLMYVVHADKENGRITLSTKEFEDDDHVGWMLSFPERCFAMAEESVKKYHEKREAYIGWLQR